MARISTQKNNVQPFISKNEKQEHFFLPQKQTIAAILNYSRSLEVKMNSTIIATMILN